MIPDTRIALFVEIKKQFGTQRRLYIEGPFAYQRLSLILNDYRSPTLQEISQLSQILKKEPTQLFPELRALYASKDN